MTVTDQVSSQVSVAKKEQMHVNEVKVKFHEPAKFPKNNISIIASDLGTQSSTAPLCGGSNWIMTGTELYRQTDERTQSD